MERKAYTKPELTVVSFRNERGYATSGDNVTATIWLSTVIGGGNSNYQDMESFSDHDTWNQSNGDAFWN